MPRKKNRVEQYISRFVHCIILLYNQIEEKKKQKSIVLYILYYRLLIEHNELFIERQGHHFEIFDKKY
jgi:hypothetical protein